MNSVHPSFSTASQLGRRALCRRFGIAALLAAALGLAGCDNGPVTVKIGVAQPMSGGLGPLGKDMLNGVNLAVAEINKQGLSVAGRKVTLEVVSVDDEAKADLAVPKAQELVDAGVVAVIGHLNSGLSIPAAPIYAAKGIAQLAISTNPKYTQLGFPTTLRLVANDNLQAKALGAYAVDTLRGQKIALVDDGTPYGKGLSQITAEVLKARKGNVVLNQSLDDKVVKFDALIPKLKEAGVDLLISTLNDFQVVALLEQLNTAGLKDIKVLGGDTLKTASIAKTELAANVIATSPVLSAAEFPNGRAFVEAYTAAFKQDVVYGAHYTYDAVYAITRAMRLGRSIKPADITKALRENEFYGPVTGTNRFGPDGELLYASVGIYGVNRGTWELKLRAADFK